MLTKNFSWYEFLRTNVPGGTDKNLQSLNDTILNNIAITAQSLQNLRDLFGHPIRVNSGYRCPYVNAIVGGVKNSSHLQGLAADIAPVNPKSSSLNELINIAEKFKGELGITEIVKHKTYVHLGFFPF